MAINLCQLGPMGKLRATCPAYDNPHGIIRVRGDPSRGIPDRSNPWSLIKDMDDEIPIVKRIHFAIITFGGGADLLQASRSSIRSAIARTWRSEVALQIRNRSYEEIPPSTNRRISLISRAAEIIV
jgi:hypothetical protein